MFVLPINSKKIRKLQALLFLSVKNLFPLDYEKRSGRSYEVLDGIKSLSFKYTAKTVKTVEEKEEKTETTKPGAQSTDKDKQKQPSKKAKKPKTEISYTSDLATWNSDEKTESEPKKEEPKEKKLPIPVFVDIEVILWDNAQQREFKYQFTLEILTDTEFVQKKRPWSFMSFFQKQQDKDKTDDKKGAQPPQPGAPKPPTTWITAKNRVQCSLSAKFKFTKTVRRAL